MNDLNGAEQVTHGADAEAEEKLERRGQNIVNSSTSSSSRGGNHTSRELEQPNNGSVDVREGGGNDINNSNNDFWEQMTAREGRAAARRAGMRSGDWQAQMQLQEALRESRRVRSKKAYERILSARVHVCLRPRCFTPNLDCVKISVIVRGQRVVHRKKGHRGKVHRHCRHTQRTEKSFKQTAKISGAL